MERPPARGVRGSLVGLLVALGPGCGESRAGSASDAPRPFEVAWFEGFGSTATEFPYGLSATPEQVVVAGVGAGSLDWGTGVLTPEDGLAPFVVGLDGAGEAVFGAMARVSENPGHVAVAAEPAGGAVLVGSIGDFPGQDETLDWGELPLRASESGGASYVARFDADGEPVWGRAFAVDHLWSVALDADGNVLCAGGAADGADFGNGPQSGDILLAKLGPTGEPLWGRVFSNGAVESFSFTLGVAADSAGNAVLFGQFSSPVDFGAGPLAPAEGGDMFVAKFDTDGNLLWTRAAGGWRSGQLVGGIAVGPDDEIAVAGLFSEASTFGVPRDRDLGEGNVLVAKLEADGTPAFVRRSAATRATGVAIDGEGRVVVTGTGTPDGVPVPSTETQPGFVVEYDMRGHLTRYLSLTGDGVSPASVAAIGGGSVFMTGSFGDDVTADARTLSGAGPADCYVGRLEDAINE